MNHKCELCDNDANKSAVIGDYYYRNLCMSCFANLISGQSVSSGHAEYNRGRDIEENEAAIIQPYNGDGSISTEFIHLYPERARSMWSEEQIDAATRA
jgi:hypothetical protein